MSLNYAASLRRNYLSGISTPSSLEIGTNPIQALGLSLLCDCKSRFRYDCSTVASSSVFCLLLHSGDIFTGMGASLNTKSSNTANAVLLIPVKVERLCTTYSACKSSTFTEITGQSSQVRLPHAHWSICKRYGSVCYKLMAKNKMVQNSSVI